MYLCHLSIPILTLLALPVFAEDKADPTKSNLPVEAKLILKTTKFKLEQSRRRHKWCAGSRTSFKTRVQNWGRRLRKL